MEAFIHQHNRMSSSSYIYWMKCTRSVTLMSVFNTRLQQQKDKEAKDTECCQWVLMSEGIS